MAYTLTHISDVHLGPLPDVRTVDLLSKRITGYVNWKRNRAAHMESGTLKRLLTSMKGLAPDHVAVTGDLTNLALDAEIVNAAVWLRELGSPENVSVVPGNHDAYVPGALSKAVTAWKTYMTTEAPNAPTTRNGFPFLRERGPLGVIGVNSAVATAPFMASGIFTRTQAEGLASVLDTAREEGLFRVVLIHHPPVRRAASPQKRLYGIRLFQSVIRRHGAELVLHGHTHVPQRHWIDAPDGKQVPVIGVPAGGQAPGGRKPAAAFNHFEIDGEPGDWRCTLKEYSVAGKVGAITVTERRVLHGPETDSGSSSGPAGSGRREAARLRQ
ncbi:metallophosphoesterase family protein [Oricola indica]|uniref:metallophosphoesterase family protein n=1 Tax=Oricola indica TaxID=2872591 RepID=UPI003CCBEB96